MTKMVLMLSLAVLIALIGCTNVPQACTEEAKLCPYGGAVGRIAPDCAFAPCAGKCTADDQCRLIYNTCFCEAVPVGDARQDLPLDPVIRCIKLNDCNIPGKMLAVCEAGQCAVKAAPVQECVKEGESLGPVLSPRKECCSGLIQAVPTGILGTRGTCEKPEYLSICEKDGDCVRQPSCCDCGVGRWVNEKYRSNVTCENTCKCAIMDAVGVCENSTCVGRQRNPAPECTTDIDCVKDVCCHAAGCVPKEDAPNCVAMMMCTQNCAPYTLDCGGSCVCQNGVCTGFRANN